MPLTVFDCKGIPATRRERIVAAVEAGGKHLRDSIRATLTRQQELLLSRCATNGIADGFTVPLHAPQADATHAASCTVIPDAPTLPVEHFAAVQWMAPALFEAARSERARLNVVQHERSLSDRERECLLFAARGKSDWVVGRILGISERTVHNHIENAKRRLRVTTRVQAVVLAYECGLVRPGG